MKEAKINITANILFPVFMNANEIFNIFVDTYEQVVHTYNTNYLMQTLNLV